MFKNRIQDVDKLQKEIDSFRPLKQAQSTMLREYFKIGSTYSSNALEGNTLSEMETKIVIEEGITIGGKTLNDHNEALGHANAFDFIHTLVENKNFSEEEILRIHKLFYEKVDSINAGVYRDSAVLITGSDVQLPAPKEIPHLMKNFIKEAKSLEAKDHPVEYAAKVHNLLVTIHPFFDGNGRTARLLMNLVLMQKGYVITILPPSLRSEYLQATRKGNDEIHEPFINFLSSMVYETQKDYLRMLKSLAD